MPNKYSKTYFDTGEKWDYTNWSPNEPKIPDAIVLLKNAEWMASDVPSTSPLPFICEGRAPTIDKQPSRTSQSLDYFDYSDTQEVRNPNNFESSNQDTFTTFETSNQELNAFNRFGQQSGRSK